MKNPTAFLFQVFRFSGLPRRAPHFRFQLFKFLLFPLALALTPGAQATQQYWDTSTTAGYQVGNGDWGTSSDWTVNGTTLTTWTSGNDADFNGLGISSVTVNSAVAAGIVYVGNNPGNGANTTVFFSGNNTLTGSGAFYVGYINSGVGNTAYETFIQTGGTITINGGSGLVMGRFGTTGSYYMSGGSLNVGSNPIRLGNAISSGTANSGNSSGTFVLDGSGTVSSSYITLGLSGQSGSVGSGVLALNSGSLTSGTLTLGSVATYTSGTLDLNNTGSGSTLTLSSIVNGSGTGTFNFNGGTLAPSGASTAFMTGLSGAYIYAGGAVIDTSSASGANTISQNLLAAPNGGYGLPMTALTPSNAGSGYQSAPTVTFSSPTTGTTATGYAVLNTDGSINKIVMTSPGSGYSSSQSVSVSLSGGGGSGATVANQTASVSQTTGGLTKQGSGTLTLSGANTYAGATTVSGGTLDLDNQNAVQNSTLTMSGGSLVFDSGVSGNAFTFGGLAASSSGAGYNIALQNNAGSPAAVALTVGGNNASTTYAGVLSAAGSLTKAGTGTLTLSGANTLAGGLTVSGGKLVVSSQNSASGAVSVGTAGALGVTVSGANVWSPSSLTLGSGSTGATLEFNGITSTTTAPLNPSSVTANGTTTVNINSGTGLTSSSVSYLMTHAGSIGSYTLGTQPPGVQGSLSVNGSGVLVYPVTSYADIWNATPSGNWDTASANWTGNAANNSPLNSYQNSDAVLFNDSVTGPNTVTVTAAVTPSAITVTNSSTAYTIASSGANKIGGSGTLSKSGTASLTLSGGVNTYSGATTISGGTVSVGALANGGSASDIGSSANGAANLVLNGGTLQYTGSAVASDRLFTVGTAGGTLDASGSGALNLNNTGAAGLSGSGVRTLTLTGSSTAANTLASVIGDNGGATGLAKSGGGTWALSGANTYSGGTTISGGTLTLSGANTFGTSLTTVGSASGNAVLNIVSGGSVGITAGSGAGPAMLVGNLSGANGAVNLSGTGSLTISAGTAGEQNLNFGSVTGGYGYLGMSGGTLSTLRLQLGGQSTGATTGTGVGLISGGTATVSEYLLIGRNTGAYASLTVASGGTLNHKKTDGSAATANISLGWGGGRSELNLTGGTLDSTGQSLSVRTGNTGTATGIVNLNSGSLVVNAFVNNSGNAYLNFNGGTLKAGAGSTTFIPSTMTAVNVYSGGATIDDGGNAITAVAPLVAPGVSPNNIGVTGIAMTTKGSGYIGAPYVSITGGTATTPATAIANMVDDGTGKGTYLVDSITITCPGVYSVAPTGVTFTGGGATTAAVAGTISTGANTSGGLTKLGANTLTLSGANTFTGGLTVNNGTVSFASDGSTVGTGYQLGVYPSSVTAAAVTLNGGGLLDTTTATIAANRGITLGSSGGTLDASASQTLTVNSAISGAYALTKGNNSGTVMLGANNANTSLTVNGGTVSFASDGNAAGSSYPLGAYPSSFNSANITLNGGKLLDTTSATMDVNRGITLGSSGGTLAAASGQSLAVNGAITGTGGLTVGPGTITAASTVTLGGTTANNYSGTTTLITSGTSSYYMILALGKTASVNAIPGNVTIPLGAQVQLNASEQIADTSVISFSGGGATYGYFNLNGYNETIGGIVNGNGANAIIQNNSSSAASVLTINNSTDYTIGSLRLRDGSSQKLGLTKKGANKLTLGANATYTGATTISAGTLELNGATTFASAVGFDTSSTGILQINGTGGAGTIAGLNTVDALNNNAIVEPSGANVSLNINQSGTTAFGGIIQDNGSYPMAITKSGSGTLTLANANTYSGGTTVSISGTAVNSRLNLNNSGGQCVSGNVTLTASSSSSATRSILYLQADNQLASTAAISTSYTGSHTCYTDFVLGGHNQTIASYSAGATAGVGSSVSFIENSYTGDTGLGNGVLTINNSSTVTLGGGTSANQLTIRDGPTPASGTLSLVKDGAGTLVFNLNAASYTGSFTLKNGIVQVAGPAFTTTTPLSLQGGRLSSADTTPYSFPSGNTVSFDGNLTLGDGVNNGALTFAGAGTLTGNRTLTIASPVTFSAAIGEDATGGRSLTKSGSDTLTLSSANTYTGNTTVSAGILALSGSGSLASTSLSIATNAVFAVSAISGSAYTLPSGTLTLNINKTGATLTNGLFALGAKTIAYGGTLTVVSNANSDAFAAGDSFTLFAATVPANQLSGWFSTVSLPTLPTGLTWDTNDLATAGYLDVYGFTTNAIQTMVALKNTATTLQISKLTAKTSNARGTVAVNSVSSSSGATVGISSGNITYTPPSGFTGTDTFNAVLSDGHGSITATVYVTVSAANTGPSITPANNGSGYGTFTASGIPGTTYIVQVSTDLSNWTDYATVTADSQDGLIQFTDTALISSYGSAVFYRLKQQ